MTEEKEVEEKIVVPMDQVSPEALEGLVEEFILREGTDYGHGEFSLAEKKQHVLRQLREGRALIAFSTLTENTTLILKK